MLYLLRLYIFFFFFFNATATTEIYTLSLHDALPISSQSFLPLPYLRSIPMALLSLRRWRWVVLTRATGPRSEEHTSELQSRLHLVCRLLLEKKKKKQKQINNRTNKYIEHTRHRTTAR